MKTLIAHSSSPNRSNKIMYTFGMFVSIVLFAYGHLLIVVHNRNNKTSFFAFWFVPLRQTSQFHSSLRCQSTNVCSSHFVRSLPRSVFGFGLNSMRFAIEYAEDQIQIEKLPHLKNVEIDSRVLIDMCRDSRQTTTMSQRNALRARIFHLRIVTTFNRTWHNKFHVAQMQIVSFFFTRSFFKLRNRLKSNVRKWKRETKIENQINSVSQRFNSKFEKTKVDVFHRVRPIRQSHLTHFQFSFLSKLDWPFYFSSLSLSIWRRSARNHTIVVLLR